MAASKVQRSLQQAPLAYEDYLPDDFDDFGGLLTGDEHSGPDATAASGRAAPGENDGTAGLGIDEEVSVTKRARAPRAKLDDTK